MLEKNETLLPYLNKISARRDFEFWIDIIAKNILEFYVFKRNISKNSHNEEKSIIKLKAQKG